VLYAKLLGNLLGDQFTISAVVLLTFLGGIALGSLYAYRFVRWLWAIEAGIGLYAATMVAAYDGIDRLVYSWVPALGISVAACAVVSVVLLAVPAFLIGCSVPLFAAYLSTLRSRHVFSWTYGIYNIGAALMVLTMEFVLLRTLGLRSATLALALLNVAVAAGLLLLVRSVPMIPPPRLVWLRFSRRDLGALALASVGSAVFQLMMIKVAEFIFGPYNETFALVLAVVLLGLALGSIAAGRLGLTFGGALIVALTGLTLLLASLPDAVEIYAGLYRDAVKHYPLLVLLKFGLVTALMGLPAIGFGAMIPALLKVHRDVARESGKLLFVSSIANVLGFVLMAFVLHRHFDYGPILIIVALLTAAGLALHAGAKRATAWAGAVLLLFGIVAQRQVWDESLLYFSHNIFQSTQRLEKARNTHFMADRFKGHRDVFAIIHRDGIPFFFINGYVSFPLSSVSETMIGALSSSFAPRTDTALVLGVASGATASTVGLIFDHVDAVEINAVVLENLFRMAEYNFDIENLPSVNIVHDDGIRFIKNTQKKYSLIVNSVSKPLYFSSSKLYTRDFLESVSSRLKPDGVYTTWLDRKVGDRGIDIILKTLKGTFENCWLAYLKSSYYLLACSNADIGLKSLGKVVDNVQLKNYFAEKHTLPIDLIRYSVLSTNAYALRSREGARVNTLDFPVLEHEMARLDRDLTRLIRFKQLLIDRLDLRDVRDTLVGHVRWEAAEFVFWSDIRLRSSSTLGEALSEVVPRQFGDVAEDYRRVVLDYAAKLGTADAYERFGYELYKRRICSAAIEALEAALEVNPVLYEAQYYLGRCYERQGNDQLAAERFQAALIAKPDYDKARSALKRVDPTAGPARGDE
jgi:tetratricopeptide (TPR) repeat protein/MFS family permease